MCNGRGCPLSTYPVTDVLDGRVVRVELRNDGGREEAEWIRDEVVAEPGEGCEISKCVHNQGRVRTCSQHWLPISFQHQPVRIFGLDRMLAVLRRVDHADSEETDDDRELSRQ